MITNSNAKEEIFEKQKSMSRSFGLRKSRELLLLQRCGGGFFNRYQAGINVRCGGGLD